MFEVDNPDSVVRSKFGFWGDEYGYLNTKGVKYGDPSVLMGNEKGEERMECYEVYQIDFKK